MITWNILSLNVLGRSSDPVFTLLRSIGELEAESLKVLGCLLRIKGSLGVLHRSASSHQGTFRVLRGLFRLINDNAVRFSSSAGKNLHLLWNMTSVAREILLLIIDLSCHFDAYNCFS